MLGDLEVVFLLVELLIKEFNVVLHVTDCRISPADPGLKSVRKLFATLELVLRLLNSLLARRRELACCLGLLNFDARLLNSGALLGILLGNYVDLIIDDWSRSGTHVKVVVAGLLVLSRMGHIHFDRVRVGSWSRAVRPLSSLSHLACIGFVVKVREEADEGTYYPHGGEVS